MKRIACYISGHGYGHAARAAVVLAALGGRYRLFIKTEIPEEFFHLHLQPFQWTRRQVDAGCEQTDFLHIDVEASFLNLARFQSAGETWLAGERDWLENHSIDLVLSDASSAPLKAAKTLGLPGLLIANFTWHDIYSRFPGAETRQPLLNTLREEYACATLQILPQCHIENNVTPRRQEVGFIALKGRDVRAALAAELPLSPENKTLVFIYLGKKETRRVAWENLARLTGCLFVTRDPLPESVPNLFVLDERFTYPDLIASCDVVCTKGGYSTLATAFHHGKPVISCTRKDFFEFEIMRNFMENKGVGRILEDRDFYSGNWDIPIKEALELSVKNKVLLDGEREVAHQIENILSGENAGAAHPQSRIP